MQEIPKRIADESKPSPMLSEGVKLQGDFGVFESFAHLPILHGFQWNNPQNIGYKTEPGYPSEEALKKVRNRVIEFVNNLGMNGELAVLAHAVPGQTRIIDITDTAILEDYGVQGLFTPEGNAFFTTISGLPLYATMRDCTQTIFYGEREGLPPVVGLIHSGRKEADAKFPLKAVTHAIQHYGIDPKKIKLGIAPSLEPAHHEIQEEDFSQHITNPDDWKPYIIHSEKGPYHVDVGSYVAGQFMMVGVPPENIEVYLDGTYESSGNGKGFSHRRTRHHNTQPSMFGIAVQIP